MTVAKTRDGMVRGAEIADGVLAWRGIPYARPPVGNLRFRPPEPPEPWAGVRDALQYGNRSPQAEPVPDPQSPPMSEDCLYLNVTAPAGAVGRPVLFWLHGGGFEIGQGPNQAAALRWTHENIADFGGDPRQITVYGLSAGAKSVTNLLASPLTAGMIARAAESSGGEHVKDAAQTRALSGRFLAELGASADRLRSVPAEEILHAQTAVAAPPR